MALRQFRTGVDRRTGALLRGRAHAEQSVTVILTTRLRSRLMRLDFGSDLAALRGENLTAANVLRAYGEIVTAIHSQEPNVRIAEVAPLHLDGRAGAIGFALRYLHYPFGHLGDYTVVEDGTLEFPIATLAGGTS